MDEQLYCKSGTDESLDSVCVECGYTNQSIIHYCPVCGERMAN